MNTVRHDTNHKKMAAFWKMPTSFFKDLKRAFITWLNKQEIRAIQRPEWHWKFYKAMILQQEVSYFFCLLQTLDYFHCSTQKKELHLIVQM